MTSNIGTPFMGLLASILSGFGVTTGDLALAEASVLGVGGQPKPKRNLHWRRTFERTPLTRRDGTTVYLPNGNPVLTERLALVDGSRYPKPPVDKPKPPVDKPKHLRMAS